MSEQGFVIVRTTLRSGRRWFYCLEAQRSWTGKTDLAKVFTDRAEAERVAESEQRYCRDADVSVEEASDVKENR